MPENAFMTTSAHTTLKLHLHLQPAHNKEHRDVIGRPVLPNAMWQRTPCVELQ